MGSLSMLEAKLPPGFRFHPRDDELICDYLMKKIAGGGSGGGVEDDQDHHQLPILIQVDLNKCEPWDIPEVACVGMNGRKEWYFYCRRDRKYATGLRTNRATVSGYWKATGKDREVMNKSSLVGMRKTLVFYQGRAPKGKKTNWVMHEFRLVGNSSPTKDDDWVLCRVFHKKNEDSSAMNKQATGMSSGSLFTHYSQDDDDSFNYCHSSSSLPPLMDQFFTFDQSQLPNLDQYQSSPSISQIFHDQSKNILLSSTNNIIDNHNFYIPDTLSSQKYLSDLIFTQQYFNQ